MRKFIILTLLTAVTLTGCTARFASDGWEEQILWVLQEDSGTSSYTPYHNRIVKEQGGSYEIIRRDGTVIAVLGEYDEIRYLDGILQCITGNAITGIAGQDMSLDYITIGGRLLSNDLFSNTVLSKKDRGAASLIPVQAENGKYGYVNTQDVWVIEPTFFAADIFSEGLAYATWWVDPQTGMQSGIIDSNGTRMVPPLEYGYPHEQVFQNGRILFQIAWDKTMKTASTYITEEGTVLTTSNVLSKYISDVCDGYYFEDAQAFSEGFAAVQLKGCWGYIDTQGKTAIATKYKSAYPFQNGVAVVTNAEDEIALLDQDGNEVIPFFAPEKGYKFAGTYDNGIFSVKTIYGEQNLVDSSGKLLLKEDIDDTFSCTNGVWRTERPLTSEKTLYFSESGRQQTLSLGTYYGEDPDYTCYGDTITVRNGTRCVLYRISTGEELFSLKYIYPFQEGLACVRTKEGRYGFINTDGEWVINPVFIEAGSFQNGVAYVNSGRTCGLIANPLLYESGWVQDDLARAQELGLTLSGEDGSKEITYKDFISLTKNMLDLQAAWEEKEYSSFELNFDFTEEEIFALCGIPESKSDQLLDQQNAALILAEVSRYYGNVVDYFYYPYEGEASPEYKDAIAYCSSLNLFDDESEKNGQFYGEKTLTLSEASTMVLRLMEGIQ